MNETEAIPQTTLGMNKYPHSDFKETVIEYDLARQSGMYVLGKQGGGKSSFLEQLVYQDICKGYAVILIDPAYDLIDHVISQMPESRLSDTYLLDLSDIEFPFGLNLFDVSENLRSDMLGLPMAVDRVMHVFERLFPGDARMLLEKILRFIT